MKEQLLVFYQQYKIIITSVAVILCCIVLIVFGIIPQIRTLIDTQKNYSDIVVKTGNLEVKAKDLAVLEGNDLKGKVDVVLYSLPTERDYPSSLNVVQTVAVQNNFKLTSLSISQSLGSNSKMTGFGIKAEVSGPKLSLDNFLDAIDKAPKVMKISSIEVSNPKNSDTISATVGIDVFFAPVPSSLGSADAKLPSLTEKDNELLTSLSKVMSTNIVDEVFVPSPKGKSNPFE